MNGRDTEPSAIAEEPHRIYSWEDVRDKPTGIIKQKIKIRMSPEEERIWKTPPSERSTEEQSIWKRIYQRGYMKANAWKYKKNGAKPEETIKEEVTNKPKRWRKRLKEIKETIINNTKKDRANLLQGIYSEIRQKYMDGISLPKLAREYGTSKSGMSYILNKEPSVIDPQRQILSRYGNKEHISQERSLGIKYKEGRIVVLKVSDIPKRTNPWARGNQNKHILPLIEKLNNLKLGESIRLEVKDCTRITDYRNMLRRRGIKNISMTGRRLNPKSVSRGNKDKRGYLYFWKDNNIK